MSANADEQLQAIFNNVNDWLKFAETKNAALVAADVAILIGVASLFEEASSWLLIYLILLASFVGLSLVIGLISFLPATKIPWLRKPATIREKRNVLYYGDIADQDVESYLELLKSVLKEGVEPTPIGKAYIEQIIINSKIAVKKYGYFTTSLFCLLTGIVTLPIAVLLLVVGAILNQDN